jgi:hypothetical protein
LKKDAHQSHLIFGQTKNGLVSGRLACTSSKTEIFNKKIGIHILILNFQVNLECFFEVLIKIFFSFRMFFHPKNLKSENNSP